MPANKSRSLLATLSVTAARFTKTTVAVWLVILAAGLSAFSFGLRREGFPPVAIPIAVVEGTAFVDDASTVDQTVSVPLAAAYLAEESVTDVTSFTRPNGFTIIVEFDKISSEEGAAVLNSITPTVELPEGTTATIRTIDATKFLDKYDILLSVSGSDNPAELELQAAKLVSYLESNATIDKAEVQPLIENAPDATGNIETRQTSFVRITDPEVTAFVNAVTVGVKAAGTPDLLELSSLVNELVETENALDDGYEAAVTADFAPDLKSQINNLTSNLAQGLIAVAVVSLLLIGWRVAVVTATFMATVMLAALAALWVLGYSLNTITLFGLILTLGLLVDDAIVVSESLDASRKDNEKPLTTIRYAVRRVGTASFAGTLTTVLVFAPMAFVSGVLGEFIRAIPVTVCITLAISFAFSMTFIPAAGRLFLLRGARPTGPIVKAQRRIASAAGKMASYPTRNGRRGILAGVALGGLGIIAVAASVPIGGTVGFNIFPPAKDANAIFITADFKPGTTLNNAQMTSDQIDDIILDVLADDLIRAQYVNGNERNLLILADLTAFDSRNRTAPSFVNELNEQLSAIDGARVSAQVRSSGPPEQEFPFAVQIAVNDDTAAAGELLAEELRESLDNTNVGSDSDPVLTNTAVIASAGQVLRAGDELQQLIEVRAGFQNDNLSANLVSAEQWVTDKYDTETLAEFGLPENTLAFDFGQESDNAEDFESLGKALIIAIIAMFALLVLLFRSIMQPFLVLLAVPFSFLGVFTILAVTGNPFSFFVMVGFIALLGIVVNNTILLVEAANQERRTGATAGNAIGIAIQQRLRPLVTTTLTTVAGLLPLALSNPFWEALSFTIIGGLVSSTVLVLISFPVFYIALEKVRTPARNTIRKKFNKEQVR